MYVLSAPDAIAPAIQRTRAFLFRPFRWGMFLKLCLVALITEGLGNFRSSGNSNLPSSHGPTVYSPFHFATIRIAAIVAMSLLVILLGCFFFYLITRLRFAYFHCLIHNTKEIRPGWRLYRPQAARFFRLNLVVGVCFLLLLILIALPFATGLWRLFRETQASGHPNVGSILFLALPLIPIAILAVLTGITVDLVLRDLMLPHFALDNATAGEAWAAVWEDISSDKGQFFAYALLRLILPILAVIAAAVILIIPTLFLAAAVVAFETGIHAAFADATGPAAFVGLSLQVFFGAVSFGFAVLASICMT